MRLKPLYSDGEQARPARYEPEGQMSSAEPPKRFDPNSSLAARRQELHCFSNKLRRNDSRHQERLIGSVHLLRHDASDVAVYLALARRGSYHSIRIVKVDRPTAVPFERWHAEEK